MALITDLPTNSSPSLNDYMVTDNGSQTQKATIGTLRTAMGVAIPTARFTVAANTSATFSVPAGSRHLIVGCANTAAQNIILFLGRTTTGNSNVSQIAANTVTWSVNGTQLTITAGSNQLAVVDFALWSDNITEVV